MTAHRLINLCSAVHVQYAQRTLLHAGKTYSTDVSALSTIRIVPVTESDSYLALLFGDQVLHSEYVLIPALTEKPNEQEAIVNEMLR